MALIHSFSFHTYNYVHKHRNTYTRSKVFLSVAIIKVTEEHVTTIFNHQGEVFLSSSLEKNKTALAASPSVPHRPVS